MSDTDLEFPLDETPDETDISLREFEPDWSDEQLIEWDGNFRSDGALMLVCCERDIEVDEYRQVLEEHLRRRPLGEKRDAES